MSDELNEELDSQSQPTEEVVNTEEVEETPAQDEPEDVETLKALNKKLYERATKAEAEKKELRAQLKTLEPTPKPQAEKQADVTLKDQLALVQAQVNPDDVDEVISYAKYKGITITEALKSPVVKATLSERAEQRKTAEATAVGPVKRSVPKVSDEQLIDRGYTADDPEALAEARMNIRKKK